MGWFSRIFSKAEEATEVEDAAEAGQRVSVELTKLPDWIEKRLNSKFERIRPRIEEEFSTLLEGKRALFSELEELKTAELHNPDIPEREKQIMEGNRNSYISQHRQFINMIEVSESITYKEASLFCKNFEDLLSKLASSTAKGQFVLKQFFGDNVGRVNKGIKTMSEAVTRIEELLKQNTADVEGYEELLEKAAQLKAKRKMLSECEYELGMLRKKFANSEQLKKKLLCQAEQLKKTDSYAEYEAKEKEKQELSAELKKTEEEISSLFSPLDRPMRKFERMLAEDTDIFRRYLQDAVAGLIADEQLKIRVMMEKMRKAAEDESLGLKDKEKEKTLERIGNIKEERLAELRARHAETKQAARRVDEEIRGNVSLQELDGMQYKIDHTENQIKILQDKIAALERTKEKTDLDALRDELENEIQDILKAEVRITWQDSHTAS